MSSVASPPTIVVIEDDSAISAAVAARFHSEGFAVEVAADGHTGIEACARIRPDLVVLDLMLPGIDGIEVCRRIQRDHPVPVLVLTARDTEDDLVVGLGVGADDYMTKPFSSRELVARVRALLRRAARSRPERDILRLADETRVDVVTRRVTRDGDEVHLTPTEFDLLVHLARRPGKVFTRDQLLVDVWGYRDGSGARTVDSHVRALRHKLGADTVRTVHGVGYAANDSVHSGPVAHGGSAA